MIQVMLVVASVYFLLATIPAAIFYLGNYFRYRSTESAYGKKSFSVFMENPEGVSAERWRLLYQISFILVDSTHALNFVLYFLTAKRFRQQAMEVFCSCFKKRGGCCCKSEDVTDSRSRSTQSSVFTLNKLQSRKSVE